MLNDILRASAETILMSGVSLIISYILGTPIAVIEDMTDKSGITPNKIVNAITRTIIGIGRAIPFPILAVLILPFTRWLIGTGVGTIAVIVPLTISATPYVASHIALSLKNVDHSVIEATRVFGGNWWKVVKIKLGVQAYDIVDGAGVVAVSIICYTTMAGILGGGGLGNYALTNGLYRYNWKCVLYSTIAIVVIVITTTKIFKRISKKLYWGKK